MSAYFEIAVVDKKQVYGLGTIPMVRWTLPYFVEEFKDNRLCIWSDGDCEWCEDRYEYRDENKDYGKPWGPKYFHKGEFYPKSNDKFKELSNDEFYELFDGIKGKELTGDEFYEKVMSVYKKE